jgi:dTDP-4-dehydrorhamnose 3,5-epimerase
VIIRDAPLPGVKIIETQRFEDERGWFMEAFNAERYRDAGLDIVAAQTNVSSSRRGVLRGMHYQWPEAQGKLVNVLAGSIFDVVVDIRRRSPTFGLWYGTEMSQQNGVQLWVPEGFAHGFLTLSDTALVHYACSRPYVRSADRSLAWDDPDVAIRWPHPPVIFSAKDAAAPRLSGIEAAALPEMAESNGPVGRRTLP